MPKSTNNILYFYSLSFERKNNSANYDNIQSEKVFEKVFLPESNSIIDLLDSRSSAIGNFRRFFWYIYGQVSYHELASTYNLKELDAVLYFHVGDSKGESYTINSIKNIEKILSIELSDKFSKGIEQIRNLQRELNEYRKLYIDFNGIEVIKYYNAVADSKVLLIDNDLSKIIKYIVWFQIYTKEGKEIYINIKGFGSKNSYINRCEAINFLSSIYSAFKDRIKSESLDKGHEPPDNEIIIYNGTECFIKRTINLLYGFDYEFNPESLDIDFTNNFYKKIEILNSLNREWGKHHEIYSSAPYTTITKNNDYFTPGGEKRVPGTLHYEKFLMTWHQREPTIYNIIESSTFLRSGKLDFY